MGEVVRRGAAAAALGSQSGERKRSASHRKRLEVQISASACHAWLDPQVTPDRVCPEMGAGLGAVARWRALLAGLWGGDWSQPVRV